MTEDKNRRIIINCQILWRKQMIKNEWMLRGGRHWALLTEGGWRSPCEQVNMYQVAVSPANSDAWPCRPVHAWEPRSGESRAGAPYHLEDFYKCSITNLLFWKNEFIMYLMYVNHIWVSPILLHRKSSTIFLMFILRNSGISKASILGHNFMDLFFVPGIQA